MLEVDACSADTGQASDYDARTVGPSAEKRSTFGFRRRAGGLVTASWPELSAEDTAIRQEPRSRRADGEKRRSSGLATLPPLDASWRRLFFPLSIVTAGLTVYYNSFAGVFLFDDRSHILGDRRLKALWSLWEAVTRRRAVVDYSLALNYEVGGESSWGYHAVNLTIHILAALTLFGIVHRTLRFEPRAPRGADARGASPAGRAAPWLAWTVALIWVVHPLLTQSVTYVIQRAESLMGLCYLLTLYCFLRGAQMTNCKIASIQRADPGLEVDLRCTAWWYAAAAIFCALGMGSKAVMVTAPLAVVLYDRVFISHSFLQALRRRWAVYTALAATWGVLWTCGVVEGVLSTAPRAANVGFGFKGITPLEYALTQLGVIVQYMKISLWPAPLCLDYDWQVARTAEAIVPPLPLIAALMVGTIWALFRRPRLGFVCACFFLILVPTSSIIPIKDVHFEHRMYLPLAAEITLMVIGAHWCLGTLATRLTLSDTARRSVHVALVVVVVASLAYAGIKRNRVYHSEVGMWQDVLDKHPSSTRAAENLGIALLGAGRMDDAMAALREAVQISPYSANVHNGLGFVLIAHGRLEEAIASFREAVRLDPKFDRAQLNLGNALVDTNRRDEAIGHFRIALQYHPQYAEARLNLGNALLTQGKVDEAIEQYRILLDFDPYDASGWGNLGTALLNKSRTDRAALDEAIEALDEALEINPASHNVHNSLGIAFASQGKLDAAIEAFRQALRHKPDFANAHSNLANCLFEKGNIEGTVRHYEEALRINPADPNTHFELGRVLAGVGRHDAAIAEFRQALRINPDHTAARTALEAALDESGR